MKHFYIKNYGCQMNVYDTNKITEILKKHGYEISESFDADIIILYTCNIREKAIHKVYSDIGKLKHLKTNNTPIIAVGGCMAQQLGVEIINKTKIVDIIFGPQNIQDLPELIEQCLTTQKTQILTTFNVEEKFATLNTLKPLTTKISSFVTIQEGCDNFCTYCVVPYTRGKEHSRPHNDILEEIKALANNGTKEIILLGQNVNSYNESSNNYGLPNLIYEVDKIPGIERIRYTSSNPQNLSDELIQAHRDVLKLMPSIHLPVQSGSNKILKKMNRPYTREFYIELIEKIRSKISNIAISTDIIVGFPSENEDDFQETLELFQRIQFYTAFYFKYSKRPGTPANSMLEQITEDVKKERFDLLDYEVKQQQLNFNKNLLNQTVEVLIEEIGHDNKTVYGKTPHGVSCSIPYIGHQNLFGTIQRVEIKNFNLKTINGELVN